MKQTKGHLRAINNNGKGICMEEFNEQILGPWFDNTAFVYSEDQKGGNGKRVPSGSMGWPFIGETISYYLSMSSGRPQQFFAQRQRQYGKIFATHLFRRRTIISTDYDLNKLLLQNEGRLCQVCYSKNTVDLFVKYGMISVHGDLHRKLRGIAVSLTKLENLRSHFMEDMQFIIQNSLSTWNGKDIILQNELQTMNLKLMAKQLLGLSNSKEIDELDGRYIDFVGAFLSFPFKIPGLAYAKGHQAREFLKKKIYKIIEQRRDQPHVVHNDFLTKLLTEYSLPDEDEHDALLKMKGGDHKMTWDDYKSMKFTQCVINEMLRRANISSAVERKILEDLEIKGYHIPKGSVIRLVTLAVHLDEKYYPAPLTFSPWRWQSQDIQV